MKTLRQSPVVAPSGTTLRVLLYIMLLTSASVTVLFSDTLWAAWRAGHLPVWAPLTPPLSFTAFVLLYALERWRRVRRHAYPAGQAFFQVIFGLIFLTLLLPPQAQELQRGARPSVGPTLQQPALWLLQYQDGNVRSATCTLLGTPYQHALTPEVYGLLQSMAQSDVATNVRQACHTALERLPPPQTF